MTKHRHVVVVPPQRYADYDKNVNQFTDGLKRDFKKKIDKATENGKSLTAAGIRNIMSEVNSNPKHKARLQQLVTDGLTSNHNPRADDPRVNQRLGAENQNPRTQFKIPNWSKFEGISIPNRVTEDNKKEILTQFNRAVNKFKNELKPRPKPKLAPALELVAKKKNIPTSPRTTRRLTR